MSAYALGLVGAGVTLTVIFEMLRRRRLREKYAVFWVLLALLIAVVAAFPDTLREAARLAHVQVPANLLFFVASLVLLAMNVQISSEVCRLEDRTRALAEEIGMLRMKVRADEPMSGVPADR